MQVICSVLSLRDSCVMYPSCPQCVSRLQKKQSELRCSCQKCGFTSHKESISYRYRLSLNVKRHNDIFGVTVFGSCLNPYFGIPAVGLQRFFDEILKNAEDPQSDCVRRLLLKAVEDCFVGRQFEFRIKLPAHATRERSLFNEQGLHALLASNRISGEFVASRITLPNGAAGGSSVLGYFKRLLLASCIVDISSLSNPERPPASPEHVDRLEVRSFECSLASFSRSSSWHSYDVHYFPRYWKRSPGIITSSAEQEEHSYSEMELRRSCRPQKCFHGTRSYVLSPQYCSRDVKGEVSSIDSSQRTRLDFLACRDAIETAECSPQNSFQCSRSSMPDTPEQTSSVTENGNRKSPKPSKIEQVKLEQNEHLGLKLGWRGAFSEGKDDMSFREGLSVCGWNSKLSNSSAWEELPFSESWGEFISKANTRPEVSQKNKACDSAKKMEAKMSKTGCNDEIHRLVNNVSSATEHSSNVITSCLHSSQIKEQGSTAVVQPRCMKSAGVYCTENSDLSGDDPNVKQNVVFKARMSASDHVVHVSEDQERRKGDFTLLVPGLRALTAQGQYNSHVQNKIKELCCVGGEAKKQGTVFHSNYCISEHKLDGQGASWDFRWEEQALSNGGLFYTKDAYNASADLFGSCQNSVSIVEEGNKGVTAPSECRALKLFTSRRQLLDANRGDHSMQKSSTDKCMLGPDISDPLDFVPFSQSTPISGNLIPLRGLPQRGKDQTPSRLVLRGNVSGHHGYSKTESESKKENLRECGSEDTALLSMGKITYCSKAQNLTRRLKRPEPVDGYCCKRILLASKRKNSCRNILSSIIGNLCEDTNVSKTRCTLRNSVCVPSFPELEDCVKRAHLGSEGRRVTEVVTSHEHAARKNSCPLDTCTSCFCADPVLDLSADLFADSFGI